MAAPAGWRRLEGRRGGPRRRRGRAGALSVEEECAVLGRADGLGEAQGLAGGGRATRTSRGRREGRRIALWWWCGRRGWRGRDEGWRRERGGERASEGCLSHATPAPQHSLPDSSSFWQVSPAQCPFSRPIARNPRTLDVDRAHPLLLLLPSPLPPSRYSSTSSRCAATLSPCASASRAALDSHAAPSFVVVANLEPLEGRPRFGGSQPLDSAPEPRAPP